MTTRRTFDQSGEIGQTRLSELGSVGDDGGFFGAPHHRAFGFDEQQVTVEESASVSPATPRKDDRRGGLPASRWRKGRANTGPRVDEATDENEFDVSVAGKEVGDRQAVGENLNGSTEEVLATSKVVVPPSIKTV